MFGETILDNQSLYARTIAASKRARWDIDKDVIRERSFESTQKFLPDGLSLANELSFASDAERLLLSQIQGRTYANMFGLVERFVNAKVLQISANYFFGDQVALEALVRFSDEELKHQALFRRIEALAAQSMPPGYTFLPDANEVAGAVLGKSTWAVLALVCVTELVTLVHYKESIETDSLLSPLYKDVFRFHWMEESQHAILDELEWFAEDARLDSSARDAGITDLIALVLAVDGILKLQSNADADYFMSLIDRRSSAEQETIRATILRAYRHQFILSGMQRTRFLELLRKLISEPQMHRVIRALDTLR